MRTKYRVLELFAGAGGLAVGLEMAGFNTIALIEKEVNPCETLRFNRPKWNVINEDIRNTVNWDLTEVFNLKEGELDLLSGGVPCQSFSYAGKQLGLADTNGTMFYYFAKYLNQLKPKIFLLENVKGMLTHDKGRTFEIIKQVLTDEGYHLQYRLLNSYDYGVAQKRIRLIVVGVRKDVYEKVNFDFKYPEPVKNKKVLRDVLLDISDENDECFSYSDEVIELFKYVKQGQCWADVPFDLIRDYANGIVTEGRRNSTGLLRRLSLDEPCLTLLTNPKSKLTNRCHPMENRPLTVREYARIQSFPDDYVFKGSLSSKYKQIGNAVPCLLAKQVGLSIKDYLDLYYEKIKENSCD